MNVFTPIQWMSSVRNRIRARGTITSNASAEFAPQLAGFSQHGITFSISKKEEPGQPWGESVGNWRRPFAALVDEKDTYTRDL